MATKAKNAEVVANAPSEAKNGADQIPAFKGPSAFDQVREFFGKIKDDPYALEVWNEIATSRHPRRAKKLRKKADEEVSMAQQVKMSAEEALAMTNSTYHGIDPSLIIPAIYPISEFIGKHKDDPYVAEVWDLIIASRHAERVEKTGRD